MENERDGQSVASCGSSSPQYVRVSSQTRRINISRPVYDQASFDRQFGGGRQDVGDVDVPSSTSLRQRVRSHLPSTPGDLCRRVVRYFPVVEHLRNYRWKSWLLRDLLAGISSGVMHVPQVSAAYVGRLTSGNGHNPIKLLLRDPPISSWTFKPLKRFNRLTVMRF